MRSAQVGSSSHSGLQPQPPAPQVPAPIVEHYPAPVFERAPALVAWPVAATPYPQLLWVPPVASMKFVGAGGGEVRAQFAPPRLAVQVPTATLGQLWRLVEYQQALLLILVNAEAAIRQTPGSTLNPGPRADCLTAAAQLAFLLLPMLAAPAQGGVAVSQLDDTDPISPLLCFLSHLGVSVVALDQASPIPCPFPLIHPHPTMIPSSSTATGWLTIAHYAGQKASLAGGP
ncbi:unnamed protein product [Closterium sp. Naga37s-1]|nr:unnamed protein product [Closterium sp. Naga37s-1]